MDDDVLRQRLSAIAQLTVSAERPAEPQLEDVFGALRQLLRRAPHYRKITKGFITKYGSIFEDLINRFGVPENHIEDNFYVMIDEIIKVVPPPRDEHWKDVLNSGLSLPKRYGDKWKGPLNEDVYHFAGHLLKALDKAKAPDPVLDGQPLSDEPKAPTSDDSAVASILDYKPVDSFPLYVWSGEQCFRHELRPCKEVERDQEANVATFFEVDRWRELADTQKLDGPIYHLTDFGIERDLDEDKVTAFRFSSVHYREALATQGMFRTVAEARDKAEDLLHNQGAYRFLRVCPPTNVYVNTSVVDADNKLLALLRGTATYDAHRIWTLGVCETLRRKEFQSQPTSFVDLARKSLRKELGLRESDYGRVSISWIGYNYWVPPPEELEVFNWPGGNIRLQAQVRSNLSSHQIWERARTRATDTFEHTDYAPIDWTEKQGLEIINSVLSNKVDRANRRWAPFSALAVQELYRLRPHL
ncbi:MAG TPA: hypothetical protein VHB02_05460 [Acidimicrobiales bacterium]|nr:hypothetical protein [Acidimicrobiales bacterium]